MRKVPPAIWLAVGLVATRMLLTVGYAMSADVPLLPEWYWVISAGTAFTVMPLFAVGLLELRQRGAAVGFAIIALLFVVQTSLSATSAAPLSSAVREALSYAFVAGHLVAMSFLAHAVWPRRLILGVAAIASAMLVSPPLAKILYASVDPSYRNYTLLETALRVPELVVVVLATLDLARESEPRPVLVVDGMRHASRALCLFSAFAALTGIHAIHQPVLLMALGAAALAWSAFGLLRAARQPLHPWLLTIAGVAMLWCMSLRIASLPALLGHFGLPTSPATTMFMLGAAGALVTAACKNTVDNIQLQAKGIGAIMMFGTALAIQLFLVPQSQSERSMVALDVLSGFVIALGAWMLSWVCKLAAQRLESTDTPLPAARLI